VAVLGVVAVFVFCVVGWGGGVVSSLFVVLQLEAMSPAEAISASSSVISFLCFAAVAVGGMVLV